MRCGRSMPRRTSTHRREPRCLPRRLLHRLLRRSRRRWPRVQAPKGRRRRRRGGTAARAPRRRSRPHPRRRRHRPPRCTARSTAPRGCRPARYVAGLTKSIGFLKTDSAGAAFGSLVSKTASSASAAAHKQWEKHTGATSTTQPASDYYRGGGVAAAPTPVARYPPQEPPAAAAAAAPAAVSSPPPPPPARAAATAQTPPGDEAVALYTYVWSLTQLCRDRAGRLACGRGRAHLPARGRVRRLVARPVARRRAHGHCAHDVRTAAVARAVIGHVGTRGTRRTGTWDPRAGEPRVLPRGRRLRACRE